MMAELSKSQIDRLGDRLRVDSHNEADLRMLDEFKNSFAHAFETVLLALRHRSLTPAGRFPKTTASIVAKLHRGAIRLNRMQDIAGCRVVVRNIVEQNRLVETLKTDFPDAAIVDRREKPSHGYRAVHVIVHAAGKSVEIQVRTSLQQMWAELSEKGYDVLDPAVKYGGGPEEFRRLLEQWSGEIARHESSEMEYSKALAQLIELQSSHDAILRKLASEKSMDTSAGDADLESISQRRQVVERDLEVRRSELSRRRSEIMKALTIVISSLQALKGGKP